MRLVVESVRASSIARVYMRRASPPRDYQNFFCGRPYRASFESYREPRAKAESNRSRSVSQTSRTLASVARSASTSKEYRSAPAAKKKKKKKRRRDSHASSSSSLRRNTYEILHRPAINHRRHEDSKNRKRPDRSRRQPKPTLDEFPRESVGLDECVLFHPRRVVSRHRQSVVVRSFVRTFVRSSVVD